MASAPKPGDADSSSSSVPATNRIVRMGLAWCEDVGMAPPWVGSGSPAVRPALVGTAPRRRGGSEAVEGPDVVADDHAAGPGVDAGEVPLEDLLRIRPGAHVVGEVVPPHERPGSDDLAGQHGGAVAHEGQPDVLVEVRRRLLLAQLLVVALSRHVAVAVPVV